MSYLPPQQAGYFEAIQVYFTELTERVSLFGARDRALLERWHQEGRSAQVVCRGIREAVVGRDPEDKPPRSLVQCEPFVDRQWERVQQRAVGAHESITDHEAGDGSGDEDEASSVEEQAGGMIAELRQIIEEAGRGTDEERWRQAYRQAWRTMDRLQKEADHFSFAEAEAVDKALVEAYFDALRDEERRAIEDSLAELNSGLLDSMSPAARREHLHIKTKQAVIERFGLVDIVDLLTR